MKLLICVVVLDTLAVNFSLMYSLLKIQIKTSENAIPANYVCVILT